MTIVSSSKDFDVKWRSQYDRLAKQIAGLLRSSGRNVAEIGCGAGQLTIPLAKLVPKKRLMAVDNFEYPYLSAYKSLVSSLDRAKLRRKVSIIKSDYRTWLDRQESGGFDSVISSEFLPELNHEQTRDFLADCHRALGLGGITIHSFLSPSPRNKRQRLLIEADSDPKWTKNPPAQWFSPSPRLVARELRVSGFRKIRFVRMKSNLLVVGDAAKFMLKEWGTKAAFWNAHKAWLQRSGLEIPDWMIVRASK